ncbi:hypothetical protein [Streptomyces sp. NBC_00859]|nr:hypothetical protein OG584_05950 [Streptomyces sp. NBC_00859]
MSQTGTDTAARAADAFAYATAQPPEADVSEIVVRPAVSVQ